jgi:hypothetical protein
VSIRIFSAPLNEALIDAFNLTPSEGHDLRSNVFTFWNISNAFTLLNLNNVFTFLNLITDGAGERDPNILIT